MGWIGRLGWFIDEVSTLLPSLSEEERKVLKENNFPDIFYIVKYLLQDMEPAKALSHVRSISDNNARRIFHEYTGNNPRAYHYLLQSAKEAENVPFWIANRKLYFRIYAEKDVTLEEIDTVEVSEEGLEFTAQVILKNYTKALYYIMHPHDVNAEAFDTITKAVMYGLSENYDFTTSRLLQVFIPLAVMVNQRKLAERFLKAAISTAQTEHNTYMLTWFSLYRTALEHDEEGVNDLKGLINSFEEKGYIWHEVLARSIAQLLGRGSDSNLERIRALKEKYWHHHTVRFAEILVGRELGIT